ncbi:MAG: BamA/TamA family outer membrane protein [Flavobacteriales bacterium]|nr:BamA/TamA family outer membrane protein [Flavobacteriales bacterium]
MFKAILTLPKGQKFKTILSTNNYIRILLLVIGTALVGCSPTRKLVDGEYLVVKNVIDNDSEQVSKGDLLNFIRQKPNRKVLFLLFFRFHLQVYNLVNQNKLEKRVSVLEEKSRKKNLKRKAKGKEPKERRRSFWEWLEGIGEAPVIYDQLIANKSSEQLEIFLRGKGHFDAIVKDSVVLDSKRKRAKVYYKVSSGIPYKVRNIKYAIDDDRIARLTNASRARDPFMKEGMFYDVEKFQSERERIERNLKSNGYYGFADDYVRLKVDSNLNSHQVDIELSIANPEVRDTSHFDGEIHPTYTIRNIYIHTDYDQKQPDQTGLDTLVYNGVHFVYREKFKHRPEMLLDKIFLKTGDLYRVKRTELTYRYLSGLRAYRFINIAFKQAVEPDGKHVLDCFIQLTPGLRQSYAVEFQGTNTSGNLGISGSVIYKNKNLFRGAEILQFKVTGGMEAQVVARDIVDENTQSALPFNTLQINPELSLIIPKFVVPFKMNRIMRYGNPKTIVSLSYNFQQRPDYTRTIFRAKFGYKWAQNQYARHELNPMEVNFVNIYNENEAFRARLDNLQDKLLLNTFNPHIITTTNYTYTYSNQRLNKKENFSYFKGRLESSGNFLRGVMAATQAKKDTNGSYRIFNIPFSQYLKYEVDFRRYFQLTEHSQVVFRLNQGLAYPLFNLGVVPFESSFFGGGANGIRAWTARSLGPGSLPDSLNLFDQFGDIKIELNLEYRFGIYRWFKGALFVDAGNVWLMKDDIDRPGGVFKFRNFYREFALGAGVGIRLDFSFFIIRLDLAFPIHDPGRPVNDRWAIKYFTARDINPQIGIGYPF